MRKTIRKICYIFAVILILISVGQNSFAANDKKIILGAEDDWFPYCGLMDGKIVGLGPDLVRAAFNEMGYEVEFKAFPLVRCFAEVKEGRVLGCLESIRDKTIENDYIWHKTALYQSELKIYTNAVNPKSKVSVKDLEGKTVGVTIGYEYGAEFDSNSAIKKDAARTDIQGLEKMAAKRVEYFPIYSRNFDYLAAVNPQFKDKFKEVGNLFSTDLFVPFSKKHVRSKEVADVLDKGLEKIIKNGIYKKIANDWSKPEKFTKYRK